MRLLFLVNEFIPFRSHLCLIPNRDEHVVGQSLLSFTRPLKMGTPDMALIALLKVLPLHVGESYFIYPTGRIIQKIMLSYENKLCIDFFNIKNLKESVFFNFAYGYRLAHKFFLC